MSLAEQVKELRAATGAGVVTCREALIACNGDHGTAIEWLRKKGMGQGRASTRIVSEGRVGSYIRQDGHAGVLVEVNCETDFAARSQEFEALVEKLALLAEGTAVQTAEEFLVAVPKIQEDIAGLSAQLGEKIYLRRLTRFDVRRE